jgi:DNA-binding CsgD family transcriptional regulator
MRAGIFGRDAELRVIGDFLAGLPLAARALVLAGSAGAGKTTLLRDAAADGKEQGLIVLEAMPSQSEMRLAFAGLTDLLEPRLDAVLAALPPPQRRALGVALLIEDAAARPPEPRIIASALHGALITLAASAPVLVVIDDVQWLDAPTEAAVRFAFRRLAGQPVGLLCALRDPRPAAELPFELGRARLPAGLLPLGGLSLGALHRMLRLRLGASFSHPTLRRIEAESGGNPFIALEIGRALARRGISSIGAGALPVPDTLSGLVSERLQELPRPVLDTLGLVAVMPNAPVGRYLEAGAAGRDLDAAVQAGVLESDAGRLRLAHPLLSSAVIGSIPPVRWRELHAIAARGAELPEERARHRALAAEGPSAATAAVLDEAAEVAAARGAPATAAQLLELAASLTPGDRSAQAQHRLLGAARQLAVAGETRAAARLLEQLIAAMPPGPDRAVALGQLAAVVDDDFEASARLLQQALAEAGDDPARTSEIHCVLSDISQARDDMPLARAEAHRAVADAERAGSPTHLATSLAQAFLLDWFTGEQIDESMLTLALELEEAAGSLLRLMSPSEVAANYYMSLGRLDRAEAALQQALARAEAAGVEYPRGDIMLRMSLAAAWRGDLRRAVECAATGLEIAEQLDLSQLTSALLYASAFAALQLGRADEVRDLAGRGLELSRSVGERSYAYYNEALLGSLELARGDCAAAVARLLPLAESHASVRRGVTTHTVVTDTVEALIAVGDLANAVTLLAGLEASAYSPVTDAIVARCRGALTAAAGDLDGAVSELRRALALHDQTSPQPLQRGRTLLVLGGVQRRLKQRRAARQTLGQAIEAFDAIGAVLWAKRGRAELARVSGRAPGPAELTATEQQVAELIAQGMTNRQAAADLFLTVRAVESTLTKIYAKLGVRSRTQLIGQLHKDA